MPLTANSIRPVEIFISYSHKDQDLRDAMEKHFSLMQHEGLISSWHDRKIGAGEEWADQIDAHLNSARVILLLVSPDFMASDYCYKIEMPRAMDRYAAGEATVIPVILRPTDWHSALFGKLQALPGDGKPITSWPDRDGGFLDVARGIRKIVREWGTKSDAAAADSSPSTQRGISGFIPPTDPKTISQRGHAVKEVYTKLLQPDVAAIVLTGIGGVGKSTLAGSIFEACKNLCRDLPGCRRRTRPRRCATRSTASPLCAACCSPAGPGRREPATILPRACKNIPFRALALRKGRRSYGNKEWR